MPDWPGLGPQLRCGWGLTGDAGPGGVSSLHADRPGRQRPSDRADGAAKDLSAISRRGINKNYLDIQCARRQCSKKNNAVRCRGAWSLTWTDIMFATRVQKYVKRTFAWYRPMLVAMLLQRRFKSGITISTNPPSPSLQAH